MTSGNGFICTIDSATGNILVGVTASATAGTTTGVITDTSLAGSHVYTLSGTVSGTDSLGNAFSIPAVTTTVNIEIINISINGAVADMYYRAGTTAESQVFSPFT